MPAFEVAETPLAGPSRPPETALIRGTMSVTGIRGGGTCRTGRPRGCGRIRCKQAPKPWRRRGQRPCNPPQIHPEIHHADQNESTCDESKNGADRHRQSHAQSTATVLQQNAAAPEQRGPDEIKYVLPLGRCGPERSTAPTELTKQGTCSKQEQPTARKRRQGDQRDTGVPLPSSTRLRRGTGQLMQPRTGLNPVLQHHRDEPEQQS